MNEEDKRRIVERYRQRLAVHGDSIQTLASGTEERRRLRFQVLREVGIGPENSVLDLGCGFGDFFPYLQEDGCGAAYTGYDINPDLVAIAAAKYPQVPFAVKDVQREQFPTFDFIVSTSCFNLRLQQEDNYTMVAEILRVCYEHARIGVAVDFLSSYVDFQGADAFHYEPERLFKIAKGLTKCVTLRHDYPLFEFCLYLYKDFPGWHQP